MTLLVTPRPSAHLVAKKNGDTPAFRARRCPKRKSRSVPIFARSAETGVADREHSRTGKAGRMRPPDTPYRSEEFFYR